MGFSFKSETFQELTDYALKKAKSLGATDCAVDISEAVGQSVSVRMGQIETIEHTRDKNISLSVFVRNKRGNASSSDFSLQAIDSAIQAALDIAKYTASDKFAGLPDEANLAKRHRDLDLYHPWNLSIAKAVEKALAMEQAAFDVSKQIRNSDGANVSTEAGHFFAANSRGFRGGYPYSEHSLSVSLIAQAKKSKDSPMQRDYWNSSDRNARNLAKPAKIGAYAAQRALARLGSRPINTGNCPVIFEAPVAASLLNHYIRAVSGASQYRKTSFLLNALGKQVWAPHITIKEDPFIAGAHGSSPFDEEGVKVKARTVVKKGVCNGYFLSSYSARKLGMETTGNAGGTHNLILSSTKTVSGGLDALLKTMGTGLLVTEMMGQGVNGVNGDYSRGAFGYWVENGIIVHPVEEITIAGNLKDMLANIVAVGDDSYWRGSKYVGSILIESMTVAGN
ncbi:MAG: metalloprotease PmbA [Gammaproteobacteria bacterium]|nr:metalloprotease PmbA [Gammaproteobacteria bacterium]MBU0850495.1 metalloprotease PmbA [Gammaproteobacteria bacterium]MBU1267121.1 metalloprotease PmbA [Gammaproteobacteria bacterium]MBU1529506.1 metalloprotease PmbA [Gammaproteobacteria bacterium]MBU1780507.1 metalloprotease PmbA [Gammaproteobacteria bacterium]